MELNVIETNQFFLQKEGVNQIMMRHNIGTQSDRQSQKWGVITAEPPYHAQVWEYPPQAQGQDELT